ncbi:MAG TPA: hypothetical protein VFY31_09195 [Macromonas sp.]|nr:hypothetical protein [Macromonas sp.]
MKHAHKISGRHWLGLGWVLAVALASPLTQAEPTKLAKASSKIVVPAVLPSVDATPLTDVEQAIAAQVYVGNLPCELGQSVSLKVDPDHPGQFQMQLKQQRFQLRPVESRTGAVRLEDQVQGVVWLQLANKSMLMNQKQGRRLADECMSPVQHAVAEQLKVHPAPNLLDVAQSPRQD